MTNGTSQRLRKNTLQHSALWQLNNTTKCERTVGELPAFPFGISGGSGDSALAAPVPSGPSLRGGSGASEPLRPCVGVAAAIGAAGCGELFDLSAELAPAEFEAGALCRPAEAEAAGLGFDSSAGEAATAALAEVVRSPSGKLTIAGDFGRLYFGVAVAAVALDFAGDSTGAAAKRSNENIFMRSQSKRTCFLLGNFLAFAFRFARRCLCLISALAVAATARA